MMASNLMFALQAYVGANYPLFHLTILIENVSGGMGTTAFVAYLASLCNVRYTAVQYALLTSFMQMLAKFVIVPSSGFLVEGVGWINFFVLSERRRPAGAGPCCGGSGARRRRPCRMRPPPAEIAGCAAPNLLDSDLTKRSAHCRSEVDADWRAQGEQDARISGRLEPGCSARVDRAWP